MTPSAVAATIPDYNREVDRMPRPYVRFEMRIQERGNSQGLVEYSDVPWVIVTAPGGKDTLEKPAMDWFSGLDMQVTAGRIPASWPGQYRNALKEWQATQEMPINGTPIKSWPVLSAAQRKRIIDSNVLTVEDLSMANDEMLTRIGMGAQNLKNLAASWVKESSGPGALAKQVETLLVSNADLMRKCEELAEMNKALSVKVQSTLKVT